MSNYYNQEKEITKKMIILLRAVKTALGDAKRKPERSVDILCKL
jgi:hypothetical protein